MKFLLILACFTLSSCNTLTENDLQGKWQSSNDSDLQIWEFNKGNFKVDAGPTLQHSGTYFVIQSLSDILVLQLKNQAGFLGIKDHTITVSFQNDNSILIDDQGPYHKAK